MTTTTSTRKTGHDKLVALTSAMDTNVLSLSLLLLEGRVLDDAERMVQAVISDELCFRCPEACAASQRWLEDMEATETHTEVILAAVTAAG